MFSMLSQMYSSFESNVMCVIYLVLGSKIAAIQIHFVPLNIHLGRLNVALQ